MWDGKAYSEDPARMVVSVTPVSDAPFPQLSLLGSLVEDVKVSLMITGTDPDGDECYPSVVRLPSTGTLYLADQEGKVDRELLQAEIPYKSANQKLLLHFYPPSNANGNITSFEYSVTDTGGLESAAEEYWFVLEPRNDSPLSYSSSVVVQDGHSATIEVNGTDVEGDPYRAKILSLPYYGALRQVPSNGAIAIGDFLDAGTTLTFYSNMENTWNLYSSFTFELHASDGSNGTSFPSAIYLQIEPNPDPPINNNGTSNNGTNWGDPGDGTGSVPDVQNGEQSVTTAEDVSLTMNLFDMWFDFAGARREARSERSTELFIQFTILPDRGELSFVNPDESIVLNDRYSDQSRNVSYLPPRDQSGPSFTVFYIHVIEVSGSETTVGTLRVEIAVDAVTDPAEAQDFIQEGQEDMPLPVLLINNIHNPDSLGKLSCNITSLPSNGRLFTTTPEYNMENPITVSGTVAPGCVVIFEPEQNVHNNGQQNLTSFTWFAFSNLEAITSEPIVATATISITNVNDAPEQVFNKITINEGELTRIPVKGYDVDGDAMVASMTDLLTEERLNMYEDVEGVVGDLISLPFNLSIPESGTAYIWIETAADLNGDPVGSFSYLTEDIYGAQSSTGSVVMIAVTGVNTHPVTSSLNVTTIEDTASIIHLIGSDTEGPVTHFVIVVPPTTGLMFHTTGGTADLSRPITEFPATLDLSVYLVAFRGAVNVFGDDIESFTYIALDKHNATSVPSLVTISIIPINDLPSSDDGSFTVTEDTVHAFNVTGADPDSDPADILVEFISFPLNGKLYLDQNCTIAVLPGQEFSFVTEFFYMPNLNLFSPRDDVSVGQFDRFSFVSKDTPGGSTLLPARFDVLQSIGVNDPPVSLPVVINIDEDEVITLDLPYEDPDDDLPSAIVITVPTLGTLSFVNGTIISNNNTVVSSPTRVTYTPPPDESGTGVDTFSIYFTDGEYNSTIQTATITISEVCWRGAEVKRG